MHDKDKPQTFGMVENWNTNFSIRCWVNLGVSDTTTEAKIAHIQSVGPEPCSG